MNTTKSVELSIHNLSCLSEIIRERGIWFKKIEFEYRKHTKMLLVRFEGSKYMKLSSNYVSTVENQLKIVEKEIVVPIIQKTKSNFVMSMLVDSQGRFSLMNIHLKFKISCGRGINLHTYFGEPFKVLLPFALYITNVEFRGNKYKISVVEADIIISLDELKETIDEPIVAPKAYDNWYQIAMLIYEEAQEEYRYEINIPCIEGELYWEENVKTMQFTLFNKKVTLHL